MALVPMSRDQFKALIQSLGIDTVDEKLEDVKSLLSSIDAKLGTTSTSGNLQIAIAEDFVGLAKESTLNSINTKLNKLDITLSSHKNAIVSAIRGVQPRLARLQIYDSSTSTWRDVTDRLPVSIDVDAVGIAKDSTLNSVLSTLQSIGGKVATEATVSGIKAKTDKLTFDGNNYLCINIGADNVGIARNSTLIAIRDRLPSSLTANGNFKIAITEDKVGLAKNSTLNSINAKLPSLVNGRIPIVSGVQKDGPTHVIAAASVAGGSSKSVDLTVPNWASAMFVRIKASYNASASAGIRIKFLYSHDGNDFDTDTEDVFDHPFAAGATKSKTYALAVGMPYVRMVIENLDTSVAVTVDAWAVWM